MLHEEHGMRTTVVGVWQTKIASGLHAGGSSCEIDMQVAGRKIGPSSARIRCQKRWPLWLIMHDDDMGVTGVGYALLHATLS